MTAFTDLLTPMSSDSIRSKVIGYAQGAALKITNWLTGGVGQQLLEMCVAMATGHDGVAATLTRGFASLDTSTDPGDVDPYDSANANLPAGPGMLSAYGQNTFGTTRDESTFANGLVTFTNSGDAPRDIAPYQLTFTWTVGSPPTPAPTYHNSPDPSLYTNPDGTVTVNVGESVDMAVSCDIAGSIGTCPGGSLSLTTTLLGCTATNAASIIGTDREDAGHYRARCRLAPSRLSYGGPQDLYTYLANTNIDGTPLYNAATPPQPVAITRVQVLQDKTTGEVTAYYATATGAPIADDVTAANKNIETDVIAVPDCITFSGVGAIATTVSVVLTAKIKSRPGLPSVTPGADGSIQSLMLAALNKWFPTIPVGGVDQVAGAGVVYTRDIESEARAGFDGLYAVTATTPAGATTALAVGHVAILSCVEANITITVVP